MSFTITGGDRVREAAANLERLLSKSAVTAIAMRIAAEAGVMLRESVIAEVVEVIYDQPDRWGRTGALKRAHEVVDEGMTQRVRISPTAGAEPLPHSGRETVMDYAVHVHDGYTQWFMGRNTGVYHEGRPWFTDAVEKYGSQVVEFVCLAFQQAVEKAFAQI